MRLNHDFIDCIGLRWGKFKGENFFARCQSREDLRDHIIIMFKGFECHLLSETLKQLGSNDDLNQNENHSAYKVGSCKCSEGLNLVLS